jgi:hypothetical protein
LSEYTKQVEAELKNTRVEWIQENGDTQSQQMGTDDNMVLLKCTV